MQRLRLNIFGGGKVVNKQERIHPHPSEIHGDNMLKPTLTHSRSHSGSSVVNVLDDLRVKNVRPLIPPQILMEDYPVSHAAINTITAGRIGADAIVKGQDDRLLVIVGPCSIHDTTAGLEYAKLLKAYADGAKDHLHILMRTYFEKPRTTVGWKGLINDPSLDGSFQINKGLRIARGFLLECADLGVPVAVEFLDQISPQYIADTVSWGAIGARTTESQCHRELASGLSTPVGFKNGTNGSVGIAIDAIRAAKSGHVFLSVTKQGISAIVETNGNDACHVILRGSNTGPNFSSSHIKECVQELSKAGLKPLVMVDCSHGNSEKKHERQLVVAEDIATQLENPETQDHIMGVMIESNLVEGKQSLESLGPNKLAYGQSITDACLDWESTKKALDRLKAAVGQRRAQKLAAKSSGSV
ncbi:3-deoxy-7-phosphoheptulonate synthase [Puccinia striiformis f. sp. tritici PST-78]|uniref:3-deoxy-7-phosphoheptulonate synthase n=2 Tax=Puccinia striiformis f. sp. tritici TaxID=168172 RepID=A0A0L0UZL6_9BASI|nr:3-deoxy-7-phosphoheptulonate synthase [Puccinia striiformis f. sp. tritici PST-78]